MIHHISNSLARRWVFRAVIKESDFEIYQYGLELIISTGINIIIMVGISSAFGRLFLVLPYLLGFIPQRLFAGGYHAKNYLGCILFNTGVYSASCLIALNIEGSIAILASVIESSVSFALVFLFAPVPAINKPLDIEEKNRNRTISLALAGTFLVLSIALYYAHLLGNSFCNMLFCGQLMASTLLLIGKSVESIGFSHH